jgi:hypothetical protein
MRRIALTLSLCLVSLGFAPAPFPRAERPIPPTQQQRALAECVRRLDELGVQWQVLADQHGPTVHFAASRPGRSLSGSRCVAEGGLPETLREVARIVERVFANRDG